MRLSEQLVGEELVAVISQKRLDAALGYQLAAQHRRVEQLPVRVALALHPHSLKNSRPNREHPTADSSTGS